jgi:hypothetical protein
MEEPKNLILDPPKEEAPKEEDQPIFKPRRFNVRNKLEKKEDSYVPSI